MSSLEDVQRKVMLALWDAGFGGTWGNKTSEIWLTDTDGDRFKLGIKRVE